GTATAMSSPRRATRAISGEGNPRLADFETSAYEDSLRARLGSRASCANCSGRSRLPGPTDVRASPARPETAPCGRLGPRRRHRLGQQSMLRQADRLFANGLRRRDEAAELEAGESDAARRAHEAEAEVAEEVGGEDRLVDVEAL